MRKDGRFYSCKRHYMTFGDKIKHLKEEDRKTPGWDNLGGRTQHWQSQPHFASTPTSVEAPDPDVLYFSENRWYQWVCLFSPFPLLGVSITLPDEQTISRPPLLFLPQLYFPTFSSSNTVSFACYHGKKVPLCVIHSEKPEVLILGFTILQPNVWKR